MNWQTYSYLAIQSDTRMSRPAGGRWRPANRTTSEMAHNSHWKQCVDLDRQLLHIQLPRQYRHNLPCDLVLDQANGAAGWQLAAIPDLQPPPHCTSSCVHGCKHHGSSLRRHAGHNKGCARSQAADWRSIAHGIPATCGHMNLMHCGAS
jgi:hypothetical protein